MMINRLRNDLLNETTLVESSLRSTTLANQSKSYDTWDISGLTVLLKLMNSLLVPTSLEQRKSESNEFRSIPTSTYGVYTQ